jgi:hypothetical protein
VAGTRQAHTVLGTCTCVCQLLQLLLSLLSRAGGRLALFVDGKLTPDPQLLPTPLACLTPRYMCEQVSHHPPVLAYIADSQAGWELQVS